MTLKKLIVWTTLALALAVLLGLAPTLFVFANGYPYQPAKDLNFCRSMQSFGVPLTAPSVREKCERASRSWGYELYLDCRATPADDQALVQWLRDHADVIVERIDRFPSERASGGTAARVRFQWTGPKGKEMPVVPWEQLGYQAAPSESPLWVVHEPFIIDGPPEGVFHLMGLGFLHLGFFVVGLALWWRNRRVASEPPPRSEGQALLVTVGVAAGLIALIWGYAQGLRYFLGPNYGLAGYLRIIPSVGWFMQLRFQDIMMTVQPPALQLVAGVVVVLGAPLAQEIFFRGGLVGMWSAAGRFWAGAVIAALAAALLVFDWTGIPVAILVGLALAWLYRWARSLLAPLLAHFAVNAAVLSMVYGLIPSLPLPVDQLCGQWSGVASPAEVQEVERLNAQHGGVILVHPLPPPDIEFVRGGYIRGGVLQTSGKLENWVWTTDKRTPAWYEWVDPEHIEVRWQRQDERGRTITLTLEIVRYKVAVNWDELTLTRESDGKVFYYRRR